MEHTTKRPRRQWLGLLAGMAGATACAATRPREGRAAREGEGHEEIPITEDLMREHGVLWRLLLVYDESARRLRAGEALDPALLARAARLVHAFIEDYHERGEERFVFPVVRRQPRLAPTVDVLLTQHARGREVTAAIQTLCARGPAPGSADAQQLAVLCEAFTRMYAPHAAREDTVIFPALRAALPPAAFAEIGEQMERAEHASVGEGGFEHAVAEVDVLERALGIEELARFTPTPPRL
jgi:hemerythrin-like domain-containing protein